jgi:hypothetical protein
MPLVLVIAVVNKVLVGHFPALGVEGTCRMGKNLPTKNGQVPEIQPKIANDPMRVNRFCAFPGMICVFLRLSRFLGEVQCRMAEKTQ